MHGILVLVTSKGQVTIPLKIRQELGTRKGSKRKAVPVDFDVASLLAKP